MGLLSYNKWKEHAIEVLCSNEKCKSEVMIDKRMVTDLIYCSKRCAKEDGRRKDK